MECVPTARTLVEKVVVALELVPAAFALELARRVLDVSLYQILGSGAEGDEGPGVLSVVVMKMS